MRLLLLVSALLLAWRWIDFGEVARTFRRLEIWVAVAFTAGLLGIRVFHAARWTWLCRVHLNLPGLGYGYLLRTILLAELVTIWFPSFVGGEALRVWRVARPTGSPRLAAYSVGLDAVLGTVSLVLVALPFLPGALGLIGNRMGVAAWTSAAATAGIVLLAAVASGLLLRRALFRWVGVGWSYLVQQRFFALPVLLGLLSYVPMIAAYEVLFLPLSSLSPQEVAAVAVLSRAGRLIPLSLAGLTAVEGSIVALGHLYGASHAVAILAAALTMSVKYLTSASIAVWEVAVGGASVLRELTGLRRGAGANLPMWSVEVPAGGRSHERSPESAHDAE